MKNLYRDLVEMILPKGVLSYFELTNAIKEREGFKIYLEEINEIPSEYKNKLVHSKGFYPEIQIQDFPIRGNKVHLCVKRRRWEIQSTGQIVSRDWNMVQSGTRLSEEFSLFLKEILR